MSEETEEYYEEESHEEELYEEGVDEEGPKDYFRKNGSKMDKAMLLSWGISIASATVLLLIATLIVIYVMEDKEQPIALELAPNNVMEDQEEQQKEVERKQREKSASSASMNTPIVAQNISEIQMKAVEFKVDTGDGDNVGVGIVGTGMNFDLGGDLGGMGLNIKMPKIMGGRCDKADRLRRLLREGGKKSTEEAVVKGLNWLKTVQNGDGSWGEQYKASMTGLTLLSYLGHCEKQDSPEYGDNVLQGIKYLLELNEKLNGKMYSRKPGYETGICAYALGEAYIITKNFRPRIVGIESALHRSVKVIVEKQCKDGGWDYSYGDRGTGSDTSVCGWQMQALKVAKLTGINFPGLDSAMDKAMENMMRVRGPKGGFGYRQPQDRLGLSGVGVLALQMWDPRKYRKEIDAGVDFIVNSYNKYENPGEHFNKYGWYYHTQACFQKGGSAWRDWNRIFQDPVVSHQDEAGFWIDWGHSHGPAKDTMDGKVFTTTLCILMLEIYYRYLQNTGDDKYRKGATALKNS